MARAWNSSTELQTVTTIEVAKSVARKWARNLCVLTLSDLSQMGRKNNYSHQINLSNYYLLNHNFFLNLKSFPSYLFFVVASSLSILCMTNKLIPIGVFLPKKT